MNRFWDDMASPRRSFMLVAILCCVALSSAGPLGPFPNVTSSDLGLNEGSCALGDVVYLPGDEFPGSSPCERCTCSDGGVQCAKQRCEPRPGCKALHRPDHCCPTYQCECEQEGRVYGNGEKLVDPADPCRVCYCQGGEVVCRRIACFVRDDCTPRLVPGRCCPEYDNCPLRGVTSLPGLVPSTNIPNEDVKTGAVPPVPRENIRQEITIKEITPVSEIPVITEVKIKEILPSPSIEVAEYVSSKSPLIPREATSEKSLKNEPDSKTESPTVIEVHPSPSISSLEEIKSSGDNIDSPPSKISFSTQDSINSEIYPSNIPIIATMGVPSMPVESISVSTTKAPIIEEDDSSFFDSNPFPPIPDDLSVLSNHEGQIVPEPSADIDHIPSQEVINIVSVSTSEVEAKEPFTTTHRDFPDTTVTSTEKDAGTSSELTSKADITTSPEETSVKENPMLNLRSAIPTEILNVPSFVPEEITGDADEVAETKSTETSPATPTTEVSKSSEDKTEKTEMSSVEIFGTWSSSAEPEVVTSTQKVTVTSGLEASLSPEQTTSSIAKSNEATEVTSQTELSSLPIETSDQNPHDVTDIKDKISTSTTENLITSSYMPSTISEVITVSKTSPNEDNVYENVETTEFILSSFGSSESATDTVETIKISGNSDNNAVNAQPTEGKKINALSELINLVSDVASMNDHTDTPDIPPQVIGSTSISDSEELILVNAGYKSKNNNYNVNSITELPAKNKSSIPGNKQKVVEIEDDDTDNITDSPPPFDKVEPTTRRPIIDNVSDDMPENKTQRKDIEIITQSYVPTINRRPTKVVMKKSNEKPEGRPVEETSPSTSIDVTTKNNVLSGEMATERKLSASEVTTVAPQADASTAEPVDRIHDTTTTTSSPA